MDRIEKIRGLLNEKRVWTSQDLLSLGFSYFYIKKLLDTQILERISRGKYMLYESVEDEYFLIQQVIPTGTLCLLSAASIYNYTTFVPHSYHLAVKRTYSPSLPDYPPIKLYYWSKSQYDLGTVTKCMNGSNINIYDKEKTICDFLKFRNKLDLSIVKEVIKSYLKDEERDLVRLKNYSKALKIETVLSNYFEILL